MHRPESPTTDIDIRIQSDRAAGFHHNKRPPFACDRVPGRGCYRPGNYDR